MNDVPAATIKKIQTLAQIAADLRQAKDFSITRLTILMSLCAERCSSRHGTGLIPKSAPLVEDVAEFWGGHFLGRGWKKRLGIK